MIAASVALERLREGNLRFAASAPRRGAAPFDERRRLLEAGQEPYAIVLGCSDSRVPAEIVFDQGLGDLFVIRVAGNIVAPSQIGSVEFAVERFGTRLVVVLGHSECGAVLATLDELRRPSEAHSPNLRAIVSRIEPAVRGLLAERAVHETALVGEAVRANVRRSVEQLRHGSASIEGLVRDGSLLIAGAEYSLRTGTVAFLDFD